MQKLEEQVATLSDQVVALTTSLTRQQSGLKTGTLRTVRCFNCSQTGNVQRECPNTPNQMNTNRTRRCFACGQLDCQARLPGNDSGVVARGPHRPIHQCLHISREFLLQW